MPKVTKLLYTREGKKVVYPSGIVHEAVIVYLPERIVRDVDILAALDKGHTRSGLLRRIIMGAVARRKRAAMAELHRRGWVSADDVRKFNEASEADIVAGERQSKVAADLSESA